MDGKLIFNPFTIHISCSEYMQMQKSFQLSTDLKVWQLLSAHVLTYIVLNRAQVHTSVGIFPGTFPIFSPGTFGLLQSRDNRTTGPSRSLGPVLCCPGTQDLLSRDFPGRPGTYLESYLRKKNQFKNICFSILASFFIGKIINF